ncbi:MAG: hypothetical protein KJO52_05275 [Maribacter sp.]|nr:hypothetical protein [Maribacter sp.]
MVVILSGLLGYAQNDSCACCTENHKAFDFWVGTWEVANTDGSPAGYSTISKAEGACIVMENWVSAKAGYTGSSTNFYNQSTDQWEQLWIDNTGAHLKLKGNRQGNKMVLSSEEFENKNGVLNRNRITWTLNNDGTIRQLWEILEAEKVVSTAFDGLYTKVE